MKLSSVHDITTFSSEDFFGDNPRGRGLESVLTRLRRFESPDPFHCLPFPADLTLD